MANSLHVLQVIDDATVGGGQQHVLLLARGLKDRGFGVTVACAGSGYLVDELQKSSIQVVPVTLANKVSIGQILRLAGICRERRIDVLHTHGGTAGLWGRLAGVWGRVPVRIHTHHGLHALHWNRSVKSMAAQGMEFLLKYMTSSVICVSEGEARLGVRHNIVDRRNCVVIRNGIALKDFESLADPQEVRKELGFLPEHVVIGTVGRFHIQKGYEYLVGAMPAILKNNPLARFLLVGEGELMETVQAAIATQGLNDKVVLTGARYDIPRLLGSMDIFVLPSLWEGFPLSLLEASAAGKALVVTDVEGNNEIVRAGINGLLVPPRDSGALAHAVGELISNVTVRSHMAERAREIASTSYSSETMIDSIAALYRQCHETKQKT